VDRQEAHIGSADGTLKGGYILAEASSTSPEVLLLATGSEVHIALEAREALEAEGIATRVVSLPCFEWFAEQSQEYRDEVIPPHVTARVSVEAGIAMPWHELLGPLGKAVSVETFGSSAPYEVLYEKYGITATNVVTAAKDSLDAHSQKHPQLNKYPAQASSEL
jgi:transketolase